LAVCFFVLVVLVASQGPVWIRLLPMLLMAVGLTYFQFVQRKAWPKRALADLGAGGHDFRFDDFGMGVGP
jgi:hypothetical protein